RLLYPSATNPSAPRCKRGTGRFASAARPAAPRPGSRETAGAPGRTASPQVAAAWIARPRSPEAAASGDTALKVLLAELPLPCQLVQPVQPGIPGLLGRVLAGGALEQH